MLKVYNAADLPEIKARLSERREVLDKGDKARAVARIFEEIEHRGDEGLFEICKSLDGFAVDKETIAVTYEEIGEAYEKVPGSLVAIMKEAADNITEFHMMQKREARTLKKEEGVRLGYIVRPLERVGVYVPGGKASYPSSVLMNALPAKVAGVREIYMATPPGPDGRINPATLVAADIAGVDAIYKMGGAQAICAFALGTQSVPKVDKVAGPGNVYVNIAKRLVFGLCGIDMMAGPSEILVLADATADARFIAADFLSQAEHDELAACVLVCTDCDLVLKAREEISKQLKTLPRKAIAKASLENYGAIIAAADMEEAISVVNELSPEHLEIMTDMPGDILGDIKNAGSVFLGSYAPEPLGDYFAGPNHVLPTNGTARFASPLSVDDFIKKMSFIDYSEEAFRRQYKKIADFAEAEGLSAHARSALIRFDKEGGD